MQDFKKLKYAELRKLAKKAGIKANQKQEKLIAELTQYYKKQDAGKKKSMVQPEEVQPAKRQRSTFETAPTPDLSSPKVNSPTGNSKRRSTFEKVPTPNLKTPEVPCPDQRRSSRQSTSESAAVVEMLNALKSDMTNEEMKQSLMSVLDKRAHKHVKVSSDASSTSIPRFAAFAKRRKEVKPITPGNKPWDKIHKKNFEKFDSIDVYLQKKRKRAEEISTSVKKAKTILSEVQSAVDKLKSHKTPEVNENKFVKPRTSNVNRTTPFKPTVINTSQMNLNFGAKKSPKSLPRKSPRSVLPSSIKSGHLTARKSTGSVTAKKPSATPFKFTAVNNTTLNSTVASTKKTFDLQASLARPITWKVHKGKLKPLESSSKTPVYIKSLTKTKIDREQARVNVAQRRADKKHNAQMARRGIKI